jgi:dUTP pyrophosphatase
MLINCTVEDGVEIPKIATEGSAGIDLASKYTTEIYPGDVTRIATGVCMEIPEGFVGLVFARSSLYQKTGCILTNSVGVIDSDYRGEILISLKNESDYPAKIIKGEKLVQIVFVPFAKAQLQKISSLSQTTRSTGGFGSTS